MQNMSGTLATIHIGGIQSYFRHRNCEISEEDREHCLQFLKLESSYRNLIVCPELKMSSIKFCVRSISKEKLAFSFYRL